MVMGQNPNPDRTQSHIFLVIPRSSFHWKMVNISFYPATRPCNDCYSLLCIEAMALGPRIKILVNINTVYIYI